MVGQGSDVVVVPTNVVVVSVGSASVVVEVSERVVGDSEVGLAKQFCAPRGRKRVGDVET